jgi:serine/threonine protein kinase
VPKEAISLVRKLLEKDPLIRGTADEVLVNAWLMNKADTTTPL